MLESSRTDCWYIEKNFTYKMYLLIKYLILILSQSQEEEDNGIVPNNIEPFFYKIKDNEKMFICLINILILHTEIKEKLKCVDGLQQTWREGESRSAVIDNV